jgi:hypothetical protein
MGQAEAMLTVYLPAMNPDSPSGLAMAPSGLAAVRRHQREIPVCPVVLVTRETHERNRELGESP